MKVVVLTCDKHKWIIPLFRYFYKKYWPDNPYQTEVVTEVNHIDGKVYYAGKESWAGRLIDYLKQSKEDKILFVLEDYMIKTLVDTQRVRVAEKLCEHDVGCVRLSNGPYKYFNRHTAGLPVVGGFKEYPSHKRFSVVAHIAFFQKRFLLDILKDGEDIWLFEDNGSKRFAKLKFKWRCLWPENNIINYTGHRGGLMNKSRIQLQPLKWVLSDLSKDANKGEKLYKMLKERKLE